MNDLLNHRPVDTTQPIENAGSATTIPISSTVPVQPNSAIKIKYPRILWKQTQEILSKLETVLGGPVIAYFAMSSIVGDDVKYFYTNLESIGPQEKLFFILYTSGGDGMSAFRIASLLKSFCKELVIVVPEKAASAGTMLSLAGDSIIMTPLSYLTAVDTSIVHPLNPRNRDNYPVSVELEEVRRAVELLEKSSGEGANKSEIYKTIFNYIHPVAYGNMSRTSTLSEMICKDILKLRKTQLSKEDADRLIDTLNRQLPAHGYPITRNIAKSLNLPVVDSSPELNNLLWKYINTNRAISEPIRTDFNDSCFHQETIVKIIESVGRRMTVRNSFERRLDPIIKGWTTLKDDYKWEATYEGEENGEKKVMVTSIDF